MNKRKGIVIKIIIILFVLVLLSAMTWYLLIYICNKKNELTEKHISSLITLLEDYYHENEKYPENIKVISEYNNIIQTKVLLFFSGPKIKYQLISGGFKIYYHEAPFGPFYGYDSTEKEWYSEE